MHMALPALIFHIEIPAPLPVLKNRISRQTVGKVYRSASSCHCHKDHPLCRWSHHRHCAGDQMPVFPCVFCAVDRDRMIHLLHLIVIFFLVTIRQPGLDIVGNCHRRSSGIIRFHLAAPHPDGVWSLGVPNVIIPKATLFSRDIQACCASSL